MKKIAVVGTVGIPACYGGFESLVENLTFKKNDDIHYIVFCSSKSYADKKIKHNNAELIYLPIKANGLQSVIYDIVSLILCLFKKPDVVLILGVSGCIFLPIFKFLSNSKIITNIDGLEWKRAKWSKQAKWFLKLSEKLAVKYSDVIISDNKAIANHVMNEYKINSQVIAYGGDHALGSSDVFLNDDCSDYYLSVCRIEPENNIELILSAISLSKYEIIFIGNWNSSKYGRELREKYKSFDNVKMLDPVYEIETLFKYRYDCKAYIHGHSAGGTNPSLVEMMHFSKNIIAFDCDFNRYSTDSKAIFFSSSSSLIDAINYSESVDIGSEMKEIAKELYTWDKVANEYEKLY